MKHIDIESELKKSNSSLFKKLPRFVFRFIARIICEDKMNDLLNLYGDLDAHAFEQKIIEALNLKIIIEGLENLPENGRCFFAGNHPFGIIDGLIITHTVSGRYGRLKAIGNDAFMFIPPLRPFISAVNVYGRNQKDVVRQLDALFASDIPITHFPAGEVSRIYKGKIQDCQWQKSFITKAVAHKRNIVPFYFQGQNSILFYSVFLLRKMFFIKANIELALLPREMFKKRNKTLRVIIGKPVSYTSFTSQYTHSTWADKLKKHVYRLKYKNADFS
jgi:1-acyl-sn-glycerol-3-phosphate acyltransferase